MSNENREVIQVGSKIYLFPRLPYETDQVYFARKNYFIKTFPKTEKKFVDAVKNSMIWANMEFLGCSYHPSVVTSVHHMIES